MGFHMLDILFVLLIGLAIFGPKALQSVARNAGKGLGHAQDMKDKVMAELPMEEFSKFSEGIPRVPLNSRQALQMIMTPEQKEQAAKETKEAKETETSPNKPAIEVTPKDM